MFGMACVWMVEWSMVPNVCIVHEVKFNRMNDWIERNVWWLWKRRNWFFIFFASDFSFNIFFFFCSPINDFWWCNRKVKSSENKSCHGTWNGCSSTNRKIFVKFLVYDGQQIIHTLHMQTLTHIFISFANIPPIHHTYTTAYHTARNKITIRHSLNWSEYYTAELLLSNLPIFVNEIICKPRLMHTTTFRIVIFFCFFFFIFTFHILVFEMKALKYYESTTTY